jgi:PBP1b-binding outer membrane lipoprotein LpoB
MSLKGIQRKMKTKMWMSAIFAIVMLAGCGNHPADNEAQAAAKADAQAGNTQIYAVPHLPNGLECGLAVNSELARMSLSCVSSNK